MQDIVKVKSSRKIKFQGTALPVYKEKRRVASSDCDISRTNPYFGKNFAVVIRELYTASDFHPKPPKKGQKGL